MATIDLGKIKFNWRGTYAGGTAYVPDDVVYYMDGSVGSSYICVAATTGNAPSSGGSLHGSWNYMAKGQATSPTTTHGDIIFRGASADQRLAAGTSGQYLKTLGSGQNPTWGTVTSGVLKVSRYHYTGVQNHTSNAWNGTNIQVTHTPVLADSNYWINSYIQIGHKNHDALAVFNIRETNSDSSTNIFPDPSTIQQVVLELVICLLHTVLDQIVMQITIIPPNQMFLEFGHLVLQAYQTNDLLFI